MLPLPITLKILRDLGPGWVLKRIGFATQTRLGILKWRMPADNWSFDSRAPNSQISSRLDPFREGRIQKSQFFFSADELPPPHNPKEVCEQASRVLNGQLPYFAHSWLPIGFPPDWHLNILDGTRVANYVHWSEIDIGSIHDVKFVWEPSRFSVVYLLARAYAACKDQRYPEAFWRLVEDWADENPPNSGVNWASGQELALRVMAWCFGLHAFLNSPYTTSDRVGRLTYMIEKHGERVAGFIDYALSQRNNHGISEAVGLFTIGTLFPQLRHAGEWIRQGRALIIRQIAEQIYDDGSYIQQSFNYERLLIDNLVWVLRLAEVNDSRFPEEIYGALGRAVRFMLRFCDRESGKMPNYGSNDGSLALPTSTRDFTYYRPALQAANFLVYGTFCFGNGLWNEQWEWLFTQLSREGRSGNVPRHPELVTTGEFDHAARCGY